MRHLTTALHGLSILFMLFLLNVVVSFCKALSLKLVFWYPVEIRGKGFLIGYTAHFNYRSIWVLPRSLTSPVLVSRMFKSKIPLGASSVFFRENEHLWTWPQLIIAYLFRKAFFIKLIFTSDCRFKVNLSVRLSRCIWLADHHGQFLYPDIETDVNIRTM